MSDKCEWKAVQEGNKPATWKFEPCDNFNPVCESFSHLVWCKSCDTDIQKPEPAEPLEGMTCNSECGMRMKYGVSCEKHGCSYLRPAGPLIVKNGEEKLYVVAISGDKQTSCSNISRTVLSFAVKAYSAKEAMGIAIEIFRDKKDGYSVEVWEGHEITEETTYFIDREEDPTAHELQEAAK